MTASLLSGVAELEAQASPGPWSKNLFAAELSGTGPERRWIVAVEDQVVVGFAGMLFVDGVGHLMNLAVEPSMRRQGLASLLLACLARNAVEIGCLSLTLEVRVSNEGARSLYQRFGFAPAGIRPRYYPDGEDALVLWVHDIAQADYGELLDLLSRQGAES